MDGVVAVGADHEGLASASCHGFRPCWLWPSCGGEMGQLGDVVYLHFAGVLTHLAPSSEESGDQLLVVDGGWDGLAVGEDRGALPSQR